LKYLAFSVANKRFLKLRLIFRVHYETGSMTTNFRQKIVYSGINLTVMDFSYQKLGFLKPEHLLRSIQETRYSSATQGCQLLFHDAKSVDNKTAGSMCKTSRDVEAGKILRETWKVLATSFDRQGKEY